MATNYFMQSFLMGVRAGGALRELNENTSDRNAMKEANGILGVFSSIDPTQANAGLKVVPGDPKTYEEYDKKADEEEAKKVAATVADVEEDPNAKGEPVELKTGDGTEAIPTDDAAAAPTADNTVAPEEPSAADTAAKTPPATDDDLIQPTNVAYNNDFNSQLARAEMAMGQIESGNRWDAVGPVVNKGDYAGDRAYGRWQVMGKNIGPWTEAALGRRLTPQQFLSSPQAQTAVFRHQFGRNLASQGFQNAASIWHSGRPLSGISSGTNDGYISTRDYVARANNYFGGVDGAIPMGDDTLFSPGSSQMAGLGGYTTVDDPYTGSPYAARDDAEIAQLGEGAIPTLTTSAAYRPVRALEEFA